AAQRGQCRLAQQRVHPVGEPQHAQAHPGPAAGSSTVTSDRRLRRPVTVLVGVRVAAPEKNKQA
ncbi:hypothetical protein ACFC26_30760, partial [Kitasatospora purpeofusca]|uniref:hypothetical protein n=1 Tax=Kitasatospora purpeofusca TaxID=67352 RepID=UPI0035D5BC64